MGDREANWSRDVLERIVALLFALATLADLAAGAPFLRRRRVMGILNQGELVARAFVIGMATGAPVSSDELESSGDAVCLAVRAGDGFDEDAIRKALAAALPNFMQPRLVRRYDTMPRNPNGKLDRNAIAAEFAS